MQIKPGKSQEKSDSHMRLVNVVVSCKIDLVNISLCLSLNTRCTHQFMRGWHLLGLFAYCVPTIAFRFVRSIRISSCYDEPVVSLLGCVRHFHSAQRHDVTIVTPTTITLSMQLRATQAMHINHPRSKQMQQPIKQCSSNLLPT